MNLISQYYRFIGIFSSIGTKNWLIARELKYGGMVTNVPRNKISHHDHRLPGQLTIGMTGGDRMLHLNYAGYYAKYLRPFINRSVCLAEFGILRGTGLAIWCDLFPNGKILGFDIDLSHMQNNWLNLKKQGAFKHNRPQIFEYDMYEKNERFLKKVLLGEKINVAIDDGVHDLATILTTFKSVYHYLDKNFVYLIEDNPIAHQKIKSFYPKLKVVHDGLLTVVTR